MGNRFLYDRFLRTIANNKLNKNVARSFILTYQKVSLKIVVEMCQHFLSIKRTSIKEPKIVEQYNYSRKFSAHQELEAVSGLRFKSCYSGRQPLAFAACKLQYQEANKM